MGKLREINDSLENRLFRRNCLFYEKTITLCECISNFLNIQFEGNKNIEYLHSIYSL